jgi:putative colanic acid biosynthesis UDP-glucose lipid carrier transferase
MSPGRRRIHPHWSWNGLVHRVADATCIVAGLLADEALLAAGWSDRASALAAVAIVAYFLVSEVTGLYRNWHGTATDREVLCALGTWTGTIVIGASLAFALDRQGYLAPDAALLWFAGTAFLLAVGRVAIRAVQHLLRAKGINTRSFAVVGVNELGFQLARNIRRSPELGLRLAGFYDDRIGGRLPALPDDLGERLGTIDELVEHARTGEVENIYITFPMRAEERTKRVLAKLSDSTASVYVVPDFFVFELLHSRWTSIGGLPAVSVFENPFYGVDGLVKRVADLVFASLFLVVAALPMAAIALGVRLSSPGPVFFRQTRYGLDGRPIKVWKFRSMTVCQDTGVIQQATKNDARVTPFGSFIRKTSLDELPQLFNVLAGSMSLVGPRPHASQHNEGYRKVIQGYMLRHKVKPGITGLAQVNGARGETDTLDKMQKRVEFDHQYIREWSPWLDIKILFKTVFTVLSKQNAY